MSELIEDFFKPKPSLVRRSVGFYEKQIKAVTDIAERKGISFSAALRGIVDSFSLNSKKLTEIETS